MNWKSKINVILIVNQLCGNILVEVARVIFQERITNTILLKILMGNKILVYKLAWVYYRDEKGETMEKVIDLPQLKKIELDILVEILECCRKGGIDVFLGYGSLIGAVRHEGFIPWDDDIDLVMTKEGGEQFIRNFIETKVYKLHVGYLVDSIAESIMRISVDHIGTQVFEYGVECGHVNVHIFLLSEAPKGLANKLKLIIAEGALKVKRISLLKKRVWHKNITIVTVKSLCHLVNEKKLLQAYYSKLNEGKIRKSNQHRICFDPYFLYKEYSKSIFEKAIYKKFETIMAPIPEGYHELLSVIYGDYMTPPKSLDNKKHEGFCYYWTEQERE